MNRTRRTTARKRKKKSNWHHTCHLLLFGGLLLKMPDTSLCKWVDESMEILAAPAGVAVRQHRQALETETCPTISAHHLVALRVLRVLSLKVLLGHRDPSKT